MLHVFGYGSLVHRGSLEKGLRRPTRPGDVVPAILRDFSRIWGASELVSAVERPGVVTCARFLDLVARPGSHVNGVLVRLSDDELAAMRIREKSYAVHDVTEHVDVAPRGARVVTFASAHGTAFRGDVVLAEYVRLVEEGFEHFGHAMLSEFRRTTEPVPVPLLTGHYTFVDPHQNRLTTRGTDEAA